MWAQSEIGKPYQIARSETTVIDLMIINTGSDDPVIPIVGMKVICPSPLILQYAWGYYWVLTTQILFVFCLVFRAVSSMFIIKSG